MEIADFQQGADEAICALDVDNLCFDWLTLAAKYQTLESREVMLSAIEVLKAAMGH